MHIFGEAVYLISLAIWVGSLVAISLVVAPTIFGNITSKKEAGNLVGGILQRAKYLELACVACMILSVLINFNTEALYLVRVGLSFVMITLFSIYSFYINPHIRALKRQRIQSFNEVELSTPPEELLTFRIFHKISVALVFLNILVGVTLLILLASTHLN